MSLPSYILLSAVKDEAAHLKTVIASVVAQTVPPVRWYITDDGSSDESVAIVKEFLPDHPWIRLIENPKREGRNWAAKDRAINAAYALAQKELGSGFDFIGVQDGDLDFVAVQDGDMAMDEDFFARLLAEAAQNEAIGILGGVVYESRRGHWQARPGNTLDSVPGSALFRRKCFEAVGGYVPLEYGGSDWLIQVDARRRGFTIKVVPQCILYHYRTTNQSTLQGAFKAGKMDASLGSDFLFELFKCLRRMTHPPLGLAGLLRLAGYLSYRINRRPLLVEEERCSYLRSLQRTKLRRILH
jgi:GT2 family glycosyltransferase